MKIPPAIVLITIFGCYSCDNKIGLSDIEGVWSFYSEELQYAEVLIDSFQIDGFNSETGGMFPITFEIRNDSMHFIDSDFSALIQINSDTLFSLKADTLTYIFCRLDDSLRHVYGMKNMTDEEFDMYFNQFWLRACSQHGERAFRLWFEEKYDTSLDSARMQDVEQESDSIPMIVVEFE